MAESTIESASETVEADRIREEILTAAMHLFAHYGFAKTTMADIARETGMSPGNLYRYYRNKQAIGRSVVGQYFRMAEARMARAVEVPDRSPAACIRAMIQDGVGHLIGEMRENPRIVELAIFICSDPEGVVELNHHITWKERALAQEIARGMEIGDFAPGDPDALGRAMIAATRAFWMPMALAHMAEPAKTPMAIDQVLDLLLAGMEKGAPVAPVPSAPSAQDH
ncbi:MAG: TetR/AcrR family transcriptional regulator [Pseudomonadota bacterium]